MTKKIYNKLIRDKIPEIIAGKGDVAKVSILSDLEYTKALKTKMIEESQELQEANSREDITNELADIEELVVAIAKGHNISKDEIESYRLGKLKDRGGFGKKFFLESVEEK